LKKDEERIGGERTEPRAGGDRWDAEAFGIESDTGEDMSSVIPQWICRGLAAGVRRFRFLSGTYEIRHPAAIRDFERLMGGDGAWDLGENTVDKHIWIDIAEVPSIELDFGGATLRFHGLIQPFSFRECGHVVIRNVKIDWFRPPFSQGRLVSVDPDAGTIDVRVEPAYPVRSGVPVAALMDFDNSPEALHPLRGAIDWFHCAESTELIAPQLLRIRLKGRYAERLASAGAARPGGTGVVMRHIMNYKAAILLYRCDRVELEATAIYAAPGMGVIGHGCGDVTMRKLHVRRLPGSGRVMSTNTDATHFIGCRGLIHFDECLFEGMGDDATNVHGFYMDILEQLDDRTLLCSIEADIQSEYPERPETGDRLELTDRATLQPYAEAFVAAARQHPSGQNRVLLQFVNPLPARLSADDLLANASRLAQLRFRHSVVRNNRARAILVQTRGVEISDNTFDSCTGTAIHVNCAVGWRESVCTRDVAIERNVFLDCGLHAGTYRQASALALMTESESSASGTHRGFRFADNRVRGNGLRGISLDGLTGGLVAGNVFEMTSEPIHLGQCENIEMAE